MRPSHPPSGKVDLFRERLEVIIDPRHPLVRLAGLVPWSRFDDAFGRFYRPIGRPAKLTRLMVGLQSTSNPLQRPGLATPLSSATPTLALSISAPTR